MTQRSRKFVGAFLLLALVIFWALFGMLVAQGRVVELPNYGRFLVFAFLGLAWVIPAGLLISWMGRPDRR